MCCFFFKQKTAYEMRISDWSSDVCSSDLTYDAEWLLGAVHGEQAPLRTSDYDPACHAILARNPWTEEFGDGVAFLATTRPVHSFTTSRQDFEGGQSDPARPGALLSWDLGNRPAAASDDCCAALQVHLELPP